MNVTCEKCGKRYVISDEKVAGKASVKIRCKQCQNLITVAVTASARAAAAATQAAGDEGPLPQAAIEQSGTGQGVGPPPLDPTVQWFAMVAGKQEGPFDLLELQRRANAGEVNLRTYVWKAGMGDWKRAADVPEVSPAFSNPTTAASLSSSTKKASASQRVARDVAVANEVPSPGFTNRPTAQSGSGAVVASGNATAQELFKDTNIQEATNEPGTGEANETNSQNNPVADPFAALTQDDGKQAPAIGEATRFFIAQAGVNKRNPPWKIALFTLAFVGGPIALIYILNTFQIVKLPTVTRTDENGEEVQESFFSAGGAAGLKDLLTGDSKKRKAEAEQKRQEQLDRIALARAKAAGKDVGTPNVPDEDVVKPKTQNPDLAAFYEQDDRKVRAPKVHGDTTTASTLNKSGLSPEAAMKVVADKSKAFQTCIDTALRRNPNLGVGNVTVILNVGTSGAVKSAAVEPKKHENSDWGQCMMSTGRRIVFPSSDGETQLELPFKVGVAVAP